MAKQTGKPRVITIVVLELRKICLLLWLEHRMREDSPKTLRDCRLRYRIHVARRHRSITECDVTLCANKRRALISLIDFVVENPPIIGGRSNVTTFGAAA